MKFTGQESSASFLDEMITEHMGSKRLSSDIADRFRQIISKDATDEDLASYNTVLQTATKLPYLWDDIIDSMSLVTAENIK